MILATGCSASGGGTLDRDAASTPCLVSTSTNGPGGRPDVTFGFTATATPSTTELVTTFDGNFIDSCAGVMLIGHGTVNKVSPPPEAPLNVSGCLAGVPSYTSTNPNKAGTGQLALVVCDFGGPAAGGKNIGGDFVLITALGGPYDQYGIIGTVNRGNIVLR